MITATKLRTIVDLRLSEARDLADRLQAGQTPEAIDALLVEANELLGGRGVKSIEGEDEIEGYGKVALLYVERGSKDQATLLYDTEAQRFDVGTWGGWIADHDGDLEDEEDEEGEAEEDEEDEDDDEDEEEEDDEFDEPEE